MHRLAMILTVTLLVSGGKGVAHEYWIEPEDFQIAPGAALIAELLNGEEFVGVSIAYLPRNFERFEVVSGAAVRPVEGRMGDTPALRMEDVSDGLAIALVETSPASLRYEEWERFLSFAEHKDFPDIEAQHDARGLPREGFRERYTRHAKALVAVGDGAGADRHFGMVTEIVALANPYTDDLSEGLPVQVFFGEEIRPDAQVELFDRGPDGTVRITLHRTDAEGIAQLPVTPGHAYLVDAVVLEPIETNAPRHPVWRTYWAALSFAVPPEAD